MITSHAALETAVQPQVAPLVARVNALVPPAAANVAEPELNEVTAHAAASWVTVWTCPPALIVAVREAAFGFAETL